MPPKKAGIIVPRCFCGEGGGRERKMRKFKKAAGLTQLSYDGTLKYNAILGV